MRLGTKGRYAVMAMADLALAGVSGPRALCEVAGSQEISLAYLEQLFMKLRRAGLVQSARGPGGGYRLARCAAEISVGSIVDAVDDRLRTTRCGAGGGLDCEQADGEGSPAATSCRKDGQRCVTHDLWAELDRQVSLYLDSVTLADLCERRVAGTARLFAADTLEPAVPPLRS